MARYFLSTSVQGKKVNCPFCKEDFIITEKCLYQPSYEIEVRCSNCDKHIYELTVWMTHDFNGKELLDKSTAEVLQEAIDMYGFLPLYDRDRWPLTFTSSKHKDNSISEGYDLVIDLIQE